MAKTAISSATGVGKSRKASELRRKLLGGPSALLVDPMGFDAGDSNLYRYVNNAPTVAIDPLGLEIQDDEGNVFWFRNAKSAELTFQGRPIGTLVASNNVTWQWKENF